MINIVPFAPQFADGVIAVILPIQQAEFGIPISLEAQPDLRDIPAHYQQGKGNFWVALDRHEVVGTIALLDIGNEQCALRKMFVRATHRGAGFGVARLLLDTLIASCRAKGLREIYLGTTERFMAAHRFYEKNQFRVIAAADLPARFPIMAVDTRFYLRRMTNEDTTTRPPAAWLAAARAQWQWRGGERPPFARPPGPGQESVWDYPRPPVLDSDPREVVIRWGALEIARTSRAIRVLETAHPPSFYLPWDDVAREHLTPAAGASMCEWKGPARYWSLIDGPRSLPRVAWSYPQPFAGAEALADRVAFYPGNLQCSVGGAPVLPQPGRFYGGWVTPELVGPFKGEPGSESW